MDDKSQSTRGFPSTFEAFVRNHKAELEKLAATGNENTIPPSALPSPLLDAAESPPPAAYIRYSSLSGLEDSVERQTDNICTYAERNGLLRPKFFVDRATPGTTTERAGLDRMFAYCKTHPGTIVIVEEIDRICRSFGAYARFHIGMSEAKAKLHTIKNGPVDEFMQAIFAAVAAHQYQLLIKRMQQGKAQKARLGKKYGATPYGYFRDSTRTLQINDEKADVIRRIFEMRVAGASYTSIARQLNEEGIASPRINLWTANTIKNLLSNKIYAGFTQNRLPVADWRN